MEAPVEMGVQPNDISTSHLDVANRHLHGLQLTTEQRETSVIGNTMKHRATNRVFGSIFRASHLRTTRYI